jgi:hypothetical protein
VNVLRKVLVGLGSIVAVALVLTLAAPKTVRAIVSTLVTVSNTASNPVPTVSTDASTAFVEQGNCAAFVSNQCAASLYTVAAGQIAVIDSISGVCEVDPGMVVTEFKMQYMSPSGSLMLLSIPGVTSPFGANAITVAGQNLKTYASAGTIFITGVANGFPVVSTDFCRFTLSGHIAP